MKKTVSQFTLATRNLCRYIKVVGGVKLHYKDVGGGAVGSTGYAKDSALVLIHGFGAGVFAWRRVGPALAVRLDTTFHNVNKKDKRQEGIHPFTTFRAVREYFFSVKTLIDDVRSMQPI
jgi:hypothetical protein